MPTEVKKKQEKGANVVFDWTLGYNNAVLNFMRNPKGEFMLYGNAYHEAGKKLLEAHVTTRGFNSLDCVPIVFLYRQALELNLKSIIIHGNMILRLNGKPEACDKKKFHSHNLMALFNAVETIVDDRGWKEGYEKDCIESFEDCRLVVNDFNKVDPQSYTFRYPIDKKGEGSVKHHFGFDIRLFAARLDPVIELMSGTAYALDAEYDALCEMLHEAQQTEMEMAAEYAEYDHAEYDEEHYEPERYEAEHYEPEPEGY